MKKYLIFILLVFIVNSCYVEPRQPQIIRVKLTLIGFTDQKADTKWAIWISEDKQQYTEEVSIYSYLKVGDITYLLRQR